MSRNNSSKILRIIQQIANYTLTLIALLTPEAKNPPKGAIKLANKARTTIWIIRSEMIIVLSCKKPEVFNEIIHIAY